MKKVVLILAIALAALGFTLYRAHRNAAVVAQRAQSELGGASNRVAELEMKVNHQERLAAAFGRQLTNCTDALNQRAVELAGLRTATERAQSEVRQARSELATSTRARQELDFQIASLKSRIADLESALTDAEVKVHSGMEQLQVLSTQRNEVMLQLAQMQHECDRLRAKLSDPNLLQVELGALHKRTSTTNRAEPLWPPKQQVSLPRSSPPSAKPSAPLELEPDGSVRTVRTY